MLISVPRFDRIMLSMGVLSTGCENPCNKCHATVFLLRDERTPDLWSGGRANILNKQHNTC